MLVDAMRGRFTTWTRIRVNLEHVPDASCGRRRRTLDPDYDPWAGMTWPGRPGSVAGVRAPV